LLCENKLYRRRIPPNSFHPCVETQSPFDVSFPFVGSNNLRYKVKHVARMGERKTFKDLHKKMVKGKSCGIKVRKM
jgi:hypothetical protein